MIGQNWEGDGGFLEDLGISLDDYQNDLVVILEYVELSYVYQYIVRG